MCANSDGNEPGEALVVVILEDGAFQVFVHVVQQVAGEAGRGPHDRHFRHVLVKLRIRHLCVREFAGLSATFKQPALLFGTELPRRRFYIKNEIKPSFNLVFGEAIKPRDEHERLSRLFKSSIDVEKLRTFVETEARKGQREQRNHDANELQWLPPLRQVLIRERDHNHDECFEE